MMRSGNLVAISMALSLALALPSASAAAVDPPPRDAGHSLAANAALKYWQAFALMPSLDKNQENRLADWNKIPLDGPALELIAAFGESRQSLLRGAKLRDCDWGLDYQDGMGLLLPHLAKARDLARLAALHARHEIAQGHVEAAAEDAAAILALARHVGSDPIVISILVRYLIEGTAIDLMAANLPDLQALAPGILSAYETLPPGATFQQAYLTMEKEHTIRWLIEKMRTAEARKKGAWRKVWKDATDRPGGLDVINRVDTIERAVQLTEDLLPVCDDLAALVALPTAEFDARYPEFKKKTEAAHPLAAYFLTTSDTVLVTLRRNEARLTMLKAAIAVVRGGPDKLKDIKDPFGAGPFEYRPLGKGFELKSKLLFQNQPVTLTVGPGNK
ncbi:hypothetical protein SAMN05444166_4008 [Singulisphaera sp. GP187]|uniref:hypothetical protein n=1 Tax=Singulisphaera sp. GP187 TaxID=1882752 RepID=UPI00092AA41F|nr:hypothetical protein [Singulisphaera sp. GP187]SIO35110.1 hypothetical protein SAMN05444166_4008 [Singulisphaera sp. GP187]